MSLRVRVPSCVPVVEGYLDQWRSTSLGMDCSQLVHNLEPRLELDKKQR